MEFFFYKLILGTTLVVSILAILMMLFMVIKLLWDKIK